ncbi:LOW QUALITY PROTEIN: uncharacterized protein LOC132790974 [Drosophila nasuta]|uniref:LOW QUALITY PROTEIN: uncharacterized protein LOC132790974 n=1 Tax=Drosophila nasuta TaxID=42062 RepID=UPI00295F468D|nr:LOW QUALITY PROTEIN: uncharacterized protein LOC132790974 [Drosophila nasuta]
MASLQFLLCCATTLLIANALELTPQLLNAAVNDQAASNKANMLYTAFPPVDGDEVDAVEVPLEGNRSITLSSCRSHRIRIIRPPDWLQFEKEPVQKPKHIKTAFLKHQHKHGAHGACHIEITSKVPGICQPMRQGSACMSGQLMDFYSAPDCSSAQG